MARKISKSRGNGLTIEDWLTYGPPESLSQFMFAKPKTAKRLFFDVIPKSVDEYLTNVRVIPTRNPSSSSPTRPGISTPETCRRRSPICPSGFC